MKLDQLREQHRKEIDLYWVCHWERVENLEKDQKEIASQLLSGSHKSAELLKELLHAQRKLFEEKEKDELEMLLHMQKQEQEYVQEREKKRLKLDLLLSSAGRQQGWGR